MNLLIKAKSNHWQLIVESAAFLSFKPFPFLLNLTLISFILYRRHYGFTSTIISQTLLNSLQITHIGQNTCIMITKNLCFEMGGWVFVNIPHAPSIKP